MDGAEFIDCQDIPRAKGTGRLLNQRKAMPAGKSLLARNLESLDYANAHSFQNFNPLSRLLVLPSLVLTGGLLTSFLYNMSAYPSTKDDLLFSIHQLIQIPATDLHVALVFIQTLGKGLRICFTTSGTPSVTLRAALIGLASHSIVRLLLFS